MGSSMYGDVLEQVAADVEADGVFAAILAGHENDSGRMALPLRLLGGLHRLVLDGRAPALRRWYPSVGGHWNAEAAWPDIVQAASEHADYLRARSDQPPQTNEVGRSAALIGGLLVLVDRFEAPVRLFEIGCSAGLNLRADHYRYRYPGGEWGPADSPVIDRRRVAGPTASRRALQIVERHGYDIAPLDATGSDGELTLLSYVWPDQQARLDRLRGAIEIARRVPARAAPPQCHRRRCRIWRSRPARSPCCGIRSCGNTCPLTEQETVAAEIEHWGHGRDTESPFAHLTLEPHRRTPDAPVEFAVRARCWPGGDDRLLAVCSPHGPPVTWE